MSPTSRPDGSSDKARVLDLMAALEASVDAAKKKRARRKTAANAARRKSA